MSTDKDFLTKAADVALEIRGVLTLSHVEEARLLGEAADSIDVLLVGVADAERRYEAAVRHIGVIRKEYDELETRHREVLLRNVGGTHNAVNGNVDGVVIQSGDKRGAQL